MINNEFNQSGTNTDFSEEFEKIKELTKEAVALVKEIRG